MKIIKVLVAAVCILYSTVAIAATPYIEGVSNELSNSCFVDQSQSWDVDGDVMFNGNGTEAGGDLVYGRGHIAYVPLAPAPSAVAPSVVRQTIDARLSEGWVDTYSATIWQYTGYYLADNGPVTLRIGWWNDNSQPKPGRDASPDQMISTVLAPTTGEWTEFNWSGQWNTAQPAWIRVYAEMSCGSAVDDLSFTSRCVVPEPCGLAAMAAGIISLYGLTIGKKSRFS